MTGVDYPKPMVNHAFVSKINMERMKQVYTQLGQYRQTGQVLLAERIGKDLKNTGSVGLPVFRIRDPVPGFGIQNMFYPDPGSRIRYPKPIFLIA
jgi:hypothetical protein